MWYYVKEGKKVGPISDFDVHRYYKAGLIDDATRVWTKGQKIWMPLKESPLRFRISSRKFSESCRRMDMATTFFRPMLLVFAMANLCVVGFNFILLWHIEKIIGAGFSSAIQKNISAAVLHNTDTLISALLVILFLAVLRTGYKWIYAVAINARLMRRSLNLSASFAAWSFFIPFVNLIAPFKAMKDIYSASVSENGRSLNPMGYALLTIWWFLTLFAGVVVFLNRYMTANMPGDVVKMKIYLSCYASASVAAACVIWIALVSIVAARQRKFFSAEEGK